MRPSKEMLARAREWLAETADNHCPHFDDEALRTDCADCMTGDVADFAASEVSRAVRECIEAECAYCSAGFPVERVVFNDAFDSWMHVLEDGDMRDDCYASRTRELLYQRELASKGEES